MFFAGRCPLLPPPLPPPPPLHGQLGPVKSGTEDRGHTSLIFSPVNQ